jgi:Tol biopolymer transport system component
MRRKVNLIFLGIILCFTLGTILFTFQFCKRDRASTDRSASLGISAADFYPSCSPDGKKIAFVTNRDGNAEIYIMNADGSDQMRLTENSVSDLLPSWSPDGSKIVFDSDRDGNREIYIMNADGSGQTRLTNDPAVEYAPTWSPDGTRIAFHSNRDGNWEIYVMSTDGSNQTRLTVNSAMDAWPSWSPDGGKIAFHSRRNKNAEIYVMDTDGSNQTRLTDNPADDYSPSWSPDGTRIIFFSERDENFEIYTMDADGSNQTRMTDNPANDTRPSWSPDGTRIFFCSDRDFDEEIYVMDADGSNPVNLTNNAPVNQTFGLVPLPRSELKIDEIPYRIVYESYRETDGRENWEICLIDADGSGFINLTNTPEIDEMYPHASPDGSQICFEAVEGTDKESKSRNVYIMNIDGTDRMQIAENANQPCWSPDGKHIAYLPGEFPRYDPTIYSNKGLEIYNLETGEVKLHPNEQIYHIWCICWSPDGNWFVSARGRDMLGRENAFKANDKTMMSLSMEGCTPDISPDGKRISWNGTDWNINIGKLDFDSPQSNVTSHKIVVACDLEHWVYHSDWSPDGKYLTFTYGKEGDNMPGNPAPGSNICICDLRTNKWTQITTDGKHNKEPDWVPMQSR